MDLTEIEGIDEVTALVVVSEIGLDMSRFPTVKHFCAWLGLCPRVKQSGRTRRAEKVLSARRGGAEVGRRRRCAWRRGLWQSQSAWGAFLRRLKARLGPQKAVTATAHKLARQVYQALEVGGPAGPAVGRGVRGGAARAGGGGVEEEGAGVWGWW